MDVYARIAFGSPLSEEDSVDLNITKEMEAALKKHGARFEYSGDATNGSVLAIIAAGPYFEASCPGESPVPFALPSVNTDWHASIWAAAEELGCLIEEPRWLLIASAS